MYVAILSALHPERKYFHALRRGEHVPTERFRGDGEKFRAVLPQADDEVAAALHCSAVREESSVPGPPRLLVFKLGDDLGRCGRHGADVARHVQADLGHSFERVAFAFTDRLRAALHRTHHEYHAVRVVALTLVLWILEPLEERADLICELAAGTHERFQFSDVLSVLLHADLLLEIASDGVVERFVGEGHKPLERFEVREHARRGVVHGAGSTEDAAGEVRNDEVDILQTHRLRFHETRETEKVVSAGVVLNDVAVFAYPEGSFADGDGVFSDDLAEVPVTRFDVAVAIDVDEEGGDGHGGEAEDGVLTTFGGTYHCSYLGWIVILARLRRCRTVAGFSS